MMNKERLLCVGKILGAHGIKGQVRIASYTEDPESLFTYAPVTDATGTRSFVLSRMGVIKESFLAAVIGVTDRNAAEALRGTELFVPRYLLPPEKEDEYYQADILGLAVRDRAGKEWGLVEAFHDYGAGAFLEIKGQAHFMLPFKKAFVPEIHAEDGYLIADVPADWIKEEKPQKEKNKKEKLGEKKKK